MKQYSCVAVATHMFKLVVAAFALGSFVNHALAAPCDLTNNPPPFVKHDLTGSQASSVSYCELCGYGYVTITITNPYLGADMIDMQVVENLGSSGLTFAPAAPAPVTYSVDGGGAVAGPAPTISGANGSVLTWTAGSFPTLVAANGAANFSTLSITFAVSRASGLTLEGLIAASRQIQATLDYSTNPLCAITSPISTSLDTLPLREPIPLMTKLGRNVDAAQGTGSYTSIVYGNINDDVIWRIRVTNTGRAALQDMRFDDLMQAGGMQINYACPTEAAASGIAAANGVGPGGAGCVAASNTVGAFVVIVMGGLGRLEGGMAAAFALGLLETGAGPRAGGSPSPSFPGPASRPRRRARWPGCS